MSFLSYLLLLEWIWSSFGCRPSIGTSCVCSVILVHRFLKWHVGFFCLVFSFTLPTLCRSSSILDVVRLLRWLLGIQTLKIYLTYPRNLLCALVRLTTTISIDLLKIFVLLFFTSLGCTQHPVDMFSLSILFSFFNLVLVVWYLYPSFNFVY